MVYYSLYVLMLANIEVAVISAPDDLPQYKRLLGDGSQWASISHIEQASPDGLAQAYLLSEDFLEGSSSALVLGDNIFMDDCGRNA